MADEKDKDQKPTLLTPEQLAQVTEALKPQVDAALKAATKEAQKLFAGVPGAIEKALEAFAPKLTELMDGKLSALPKGDGKADKEKKDADGKVEPPKFNIAEDPVFKQVQKSLEATQKQLADAEKRAATERAANRNTNLRAKVIGELGKHGMSGPRAEIALSHLLLRGSVRYESDGSETIVFTNGDESAPLADGLKSWVGTDEGKMLLPPSGAQGSGDSAKSGAAGTQSTTADLGGILANHLRN